MMIVYRNFKCRTPLVCVEGFVYCRLWWRFWQRISDDELKALWATYRGPWYAREERDGT